VAKALTVYEFGKFQLDTSARRLTKEGTSVNLSPKSLDLLQVLVANPGRALSKSELLELLWPGTQVEEGNLAFQVSVLRKALGQEAGTWIETVPRHGYRWSAPVVVRSAANVPDSVPEPPSGNPNQKVTAPRLRSNKRVLLALSMIVAVTTAAVLIVNRPAVPAVSRDNRGVQLLKAVPLTAFRGMELSPAVSPVDDRVAFTWDGEKQDNRDVYVVSPGSVAPVRLTSHPDPDLSPCWSPDGKSLAFLRRFEIDKAHLMIIPESGGPERTIAELRNFDLRDFPNGMRISALSWSPDGKWIAASHREPGAAVEAIHLFSPTGEKRRLTRPAVHSHGDHMPSFSPDGTKLAFCRLQGYSNSEIHLLALDSDARSMAEPVRLTNDGRWSFSPAWTKDSQSLLYVFSPGTLARSARELRLIAEAQNRPRVTTLPFDGSVFELSLRDSLVYSRWLLEINIWRARIPPVGEKPTQAEPFLSSSRADLGARYSPDGKRIAFVTYRSGFAELWIAEANGSNPKRLTSFESSGIGPPAWSPDGQRLVFQVALRDQSELFVSDTEQGKIRRLTTTPFDESMPSYSRDGRWIYFNSPRSGRRQVWKMPAAGGDPDQLTTSGGLRPAESTDGKTVYYVAEQGGAIWKVRASGGQEIEVVRTVHPTAYGFAVTAEGLYFRNGAYDGTQYVLFFSFATGRTRPVVELVDLPFGAALSISPDGKQLLIDQAARPEIDLMLIRHPLL